MAHVEDRRKSKNGYTGPKPWRARYRTAEGQARARGFARKIDAERFIATVEHRKNIGDFVDPVAGRATFAEVAEEWRGTIAHLKPTTLAGYDSLLAQHLLPAFGDMPVSAIDTTAVRRFSSGMLGRGAAYQSTKNTLAVLRAVLATAVESRMLASNPAAGVKLPRAAAKAARSAREAKRHYLTAGEVNDLAAAIGEPYDLLVLTAAYTGCRAGELAGLQVGDVDLLRRRLHVRRAVEEVHGALEVGAPKNGESRTVSLPVFLCDLLGSRMTPGAAADEWLFSAPTGARFRHTTFYRRQFKPAVLRAGLPAEVRFHDLRHTCAAILIAEGAHPKAIQERLGHSSITVTMDTYGGLFESVDDSLADALDRVWSEAPASCSRPEGVVRPLPGASVGAISGP